MIDPSRLIQKFLGFLRVVGKGKDFLIVLITLEKEGATDDLSQAELQLVHNGLTVDKAGQGLAHELVLKIGAAQIPADEAVARGEVLVPDKIPLELLSISLTHPLNRP